MSAIDYHLEELAIAKNPQDNRHVLPALVDADRVIVDVGCGIGQTFVALDCLDRTCIGVDIDREAIEYGKSRFGESIDFHVADAVDLPLDSNIADLVIARVSLPYVDIPNAVREIRRVLRPGGRVWLTMHPRQMCVSRLRESLYALKIRDAVFTTYVLANGYLLKLTHRLIPFLNGKYESWQSSATMRRILIKNGFEAGDVKISENGEVEAKLGEDRL